MAPPGLATARNRPHAGPWLAPGAAQGGPRALQAKTPPRAPWGPWRGWAARWRPRWRPFRPYAGPCRAPGAPGSSPHGLVVKHAPRPTWGRLAREAHV